MTLREALLQLFDRPDHPDVEAAVDRLFNAIQDHAPDVSRRTKARLIDPAPTIRIPEENPVLGYPTDILITLDGRITYTLAHGDGTGEIWHVRFGYSRWLDLVVMYKSSEMT